MTNEPSGYPSASVVIPTHDRQDALKQVLRALDEQAVPKGAAVEVIVVDDGSRDGTWKWLRRRAATGVVRAFRQPGSGPARARNRGVAEATGDVVLFLGDDTVPESEWLLNHLEEHRVHGLEPPRAVVGYTSFPPEADGPFSRWINEAGAQFGYLLIEDPEDMPFNFFYTSNVSLPRRVLSSLGGFREDFPAAAWEDIELAYRGAGEGLRLTYRPRARVVHHHRIDPPAFRRRQRTAGGSAAIFAGLHPELAGFLGVERASRSVRPSRLRGWFLSLLVQLGELLPGIVPVAAAQRYLDQAYLDGLAAALAGRPVTPAVGESEDRDSFS